MTELDGDKARPYFFQRHESSLGYVSLVQNGMLWSCLSQHNFFDLFCLHIIFLSFHCVVFFFWRGGRGYSMIFWCKILPVPQTSASNFPFVGRMARSPGMKCLEDLKTSRLKVAMRREFSELNRPGAFEEKLTIWKKCLKTSSNSTSLYTRMGFSSAFSVWKSKSCGFFKVLSKAPVFVLLLFLNAVKGGS